MAERALPLDEEPQALQLPPNPLFDEPGKSGGDGGYGDALVSGAYNVLGTVAGGIQYLSGAEEDSGVAGVRRWAQEGSDAAVGEMSSSNRRDYQASILPQEGEGNDVWDSNVSLWNALGLKITSSVPSLAASLIPGGLAARLAISAGAAVGTAGAVATGVGGVSAGLQSGGDVFNGIQKSILDMSDADLRDESPAYEVLRDQGFSEEEAKAQVIETAAGMKPLIMAGITALTSKYGVEGLLSKSMRGEAAKTMAKRALVGGVGETAQEGIEESSGNVLQQAGSADAKGDDLEVDWYQALESGLQGAVAGGPMGAAAGAVAGNSHASTGDLSADAALLSEAESPPMVLKGIRPTATDTTVNDQADQITAEAGSELKALNDKGKTKGQRVKDKVKQGKPPAVAAAEVVEEDTPPTEKTQAVVGVDPDLVAALVTPPVAEAPAPVVEAPVVEAPIQDEALGDDPDDAPEPTIMPPVPDVQTVTPEVQAAITQPSPEPALPQAPGDGVSPPVLPVKPEGTALPGEVMETVTSEPVQEPVLGVRPDGRRVLSDLTEQDDAQFNDEAIEAETVRAQTPRKVRTRQADAAQAVESGAVGTLSTDPATFGTANDYKAVWRAGAKLQAEAEKAGKPLDPDWQALLALRGKLTGKNAERNKPAYLELRKRVAEKAPAEPVVRGAELRKKIAVKATDEKSQKVADILQDDYADDVRAGKPTAMRAYINNLVVKAQAVGVGTIPKGSTDAYLLHLKQAQALRGVSDVSKLTDFMANDFALRNGDLDMIAEYRASQAIKAQPTVNENRESGEELASTDDNGTDASELYDAAEAPASAVDGEVEAAELGVTETEETYQEAPVRDRPQVAVDENSYNVAAPKRAAVVETVKRRKVTPPGKSAAKPAVVNTAADLKEATSHLTTPTEAQATAENYPKAHVGFKGMPVTIETPKGGVRQGTAPDGTKWSVRLKAAYGYLKRTVGADGDQVDVYLGNNPASPRVFVVDQQNLDGTFDEHKAIIGANSREEAERIYNGGFSDGSGPQRMQAMTEMAVDQFKDWVSTPAAQRPMAPQADRVKTKARRKLHLSQGTAQTEEQAQRTLMQSRVDEDEGAFWDDLAQVPFEDGVQGALFETDVKTLLTELDTSELTGVAKILHDFIAPRLRRLAGNVRVRVVDYNTMLALYADEMEHNGKTALPSGWYDSANDEIVLRDDKLSMGLLVHEALHAAYHAAITRNDATHGKFIRNLMDSVRRQLAQEALARGDEYFTAPYGLEDEHEFISEAFSNPAFQDLLARVQADPEAVAEQRGWKRILSAWDGLVADIKRALGFTGSNSVLEQAIRVTQQIDKASQVTPVGNGKRLSTLSNRLVSAREVLADKGQGGSMSLRRFGLAVRTFDQIRQRYAGLFVNAKGDALDRIVTALQKQEAYAQDKRNEGHGFASQFLTIREKDPHEAAKAADLMISATMANVNLIDGPATVADLEAVNTHLGKDTARSMQAKARLPRLHAQFMALKPETRKFILASAKYYSSTQNEITRQVVGNILDTLDTPLSPADRTKVISQTVTGTLDAQTEALINNGTIFSALKNSQELRSIKGLYFPLMRQGDFVVTAENKMPDLMGGVEVEPGIVEFTAATDKDARAAYERFAQSASTELDITSVGKVRRLVSNGQVIAAANVGTQPITISYRARVQTQTVMFFDTGAQANAYIREAKKSGFYKNITPKPLQRADMEASGDLTNTQFRSILAAVDKRNIAQSSKDMLKTTLAQASIRLMTGNRIQQRSLARRNVYGASHDMARNAVDYAEAASRYLGKLKYMPEVRAVIGDMEEVIKADLWHEDRQARGQVLDEVKKRIDKNVTNITSQGKLIGDIMALSYLDKLFSPAYSIVNGMQPWMVTGPVLAGEFGVYRAGRELTRAYNSVGGLGVVGSGLANTYRASRGIARAAIDTTDVVGSIRKNLAAEPDGQELTALIDHLIERGTIDQSSGLEIAASVASGRGRWGTGLAKVDRIARQLPISVEAINRAVTAVAAYRLAKAGNLTPAQAMEHAFTTVQNTQGDYSAVNAPAFFNNPILRPAMQFKKYAQMMSHLLVDMVQRAMFKKGRERRQALKQLMGIVTVQIAMAGAMGLPGLELVKVGFMIAAALGLGDGWEDQERKLRAMAEASVGSTWAELISKGVLSRGIPAPGGHGIDLSGRLSLADMWTFGEPKDNDRDGLAAYFTQFVAGAPGSMLLDWVEGVQKAGDGEWGKAAAAMIPNKFISDTAKAIKGRADRDLTTGEAVLQSIGFRSGRKAEEGEKIGASIADTKKLADRAKELSRAYIAATTMGELTKLRAQIKAHNAAEGVSLKQKVFPKALDNVRKRNETKRRELVGD